MKNLSIKDLEKAKRIHARIVNLDEEIIQIEKIANQMSSDNCTVEFSLRVENHTKEKEEKQNVLDSDGSLIKPISRDEDDFNPFRGALLGYMSQIEKSETKTRKKTYDFSLSESDCLRVLAMLLDIKYRERNKAILELKDIGVRI